MNIRTLTFPFAVLFIASVVWSQAPVIARAQMTGERLIERMDTNGDGKVSRDEFQGRRLRFDDVDTNKDGFATRDEFDSAIDAARAGRTANGQGREMPGGRMGGGQGTGQQNAPFLQKTEIENLLNGTLFSHLNMKNGRVQKLDFRADGTVRIETEDGRIDDARWEVEGRSVLCVQYVTVLDGRRICNLLRRNGEEVHHFKVKTREKSEHNPWMIVRPGPKVSEVRDIL